MNRHCCVASAVIWTPTKRPLRRAVQVGTRMALGFADDGLSKGDLLIALGIYVGLNIVRALTVTLFYPLLRRLGTGFDAKTGLVVVWSGLRGSVGLTLALVVEHTKYEPYWGGAGAPVSHGATLPCRDVPSKVLFQTCVLRPEPTPRRGAPAPSKRTCQHFGARNGGSTRRRCHVDAAWRCEQPAP